MPDFYGTVAGYKDYHTERGRAAAIADQEDEDIQAALLVASEWIDGRYFVNFGGRKSGQRAQIRQWPRQSAYDTNGDYLPGDAVPREVEWATYEAALRDVSKPGSLSVDYTPNKYKKAAIDGAVSVEFASFSSAMDIQTQYAVIDAILAPILSGPYSRVYSSASGAALRT